MIINIRYTFENVTTNFTRHKSALSKGFILSKLSFTLRKAIKITTLFEAGYKTYLFSFFLLFFVWYIFMWVLITAVFIYLKMLRKSLYCECTLISVKYSLDNEKEKKQVQ